MWCAKGYLERDLMANTASSLSKCCKGLHT